MWCYMHRSTNWCFPYFCTYCLMHCYMHRWTHCSFPCFCTYCFIQCCMHLWTHWRFPCFFCKYVLCSVTCTVGHTGIFRVFFIMFDAVLHGQLDTRTFSVFLYTLFDALLHAPLDTLAFSLVLYIIFDAVLHAPLDTLVFSLFYTYCLIHCNMHSWTHCCFLCFIHTFSSSFTCTVGHNCVYLFCTFCFIQNYKHR